MEPALEFNAHYGGTMKHPASKLHDIDDDEWFDVRLLITREDYERISALGVAGKLSGEIVVRFILDGPVDEIARKARGG